MVTAGMNYRVLEGKEQTFEAAFASVLEVMQADPGHTGSNLYRGVGDSVEYLIVSEWQDGAAFDAFLRSERFKKVADWGRERILAGRPSHRIFGS